MNVINFETYQDVKSNLAVATLLILLIACFVTYRIIPAQHINFLRNLAWPAWAKGLGLVSVLTAISGVLIYGIQIHDQVYDRYVVRWRERYDSEVILPRLCSRFAQKLDGQFY